MMRWQKNLWWFAAPSFVVLAVVCLYPFASAIYLSLFDYYLARPDDAAFVGLANYTSLLTDERFWSSLVNTLIIAGGAVGLEFVVGLSVAIGLYYLQRGAGVFVVLQLIPLIITPVVAALFIKWMFVARWGLVDATLASFDLFGPDWLGDPRWAKFTVIIADAWKFAPFMILVFYAGLQSMDQNLIDAGRIDGASGWKLLYHVIIPALRPLILFVLIIRLMEGVLRTSSSMTNASATAISGSTTAPSTAVTRNEKDSRSDSERRSSSVSTETTTSVCLAGIVTVSVVWTKSASPASPDMVS